MSLISTRIANKESLPTIASDLFNTYFNYQNNFMTPTVLQRNISGKYAYEVSKGEFSGESIYGVTVLEIIYDGRLIEHNHDLSKSFDNEHDAREYGRKLGK